MKNVTKIAGTFLPVLPFVLFLFSCNVYQNQPVSAEEAVRSSNRVRIVTAQNQSCEFKHLSREDGQLYGYTGKKSATAKIFAGKPCTRSGNNLKIALQEDEILGYYLKDKKMSTLVNLGVPVVGAAGLLGVTSANFRPDVGN